MIISFIKQIGVEKIYSLKIPYHGRDLLIDTRRYAKYMHQTKYLDGYWVNACNNSAKTIELMQAIADRFGLDIKFITE